MELEEIGEKKKFNIGNIINYKDFIGEYPVIFGIKIVSSIALIYVIIEFYSYHNPLDLDYNNQHQHNYQLLYL